jgi:hypothetical protein
MEDPKGEDGALSIGADEEVGNGFFEVIHVIRGGGLGLLGRRTAIIAGIAGIARIARIARIGGALGLPPRLIGV